MQVEAPPAPRLLESPEFFGLVVRHASRFQSDPNFAERRLSGTSEAAVDATEEDQAVIRRLVADFVENVTAVDPEAGRILGEARLSSEHWQHTADLMDALHDNRVRELGRDALAAVEGPDADTGDGDLHPEQGVQARMSNRLAARSGEIRRLREELVPAPLRDAVPANHWRTMITPEAVEAFRSLGGWHAALYVSRDARRLAAQSLQRRLGFLGMARYAFFLMVVGLLLPIVTLILTIIEPSNAKKLWWAMQGVGSGTICAASGFVQREAGIAAGQSLGATTAEPLYTPEVTLPPFAPATTAAGGFGASSSTTVSPPAATTVFVPEITTTQPPLVSTTTTTTPQVMCTVPVLDNSVMTVESTQVGGQVPALTVVWYDCEMGFTTSVGSHFGAECQIDGTIMPLQPAANAIIGNVPGEPSGCTVPAVASTTPSAATSCGVPPVLANAVNGFPGPSQAVEFGQIAWYVCDDGYTSDSGVDFGAHCMYDGSYEELPTGCHAQPAAPVTPTSCGVAPVVQNAECGMPGANVQIEFGQLIWYDCNPGFATASGVDFGATCQTDGSFEPALPSSCETSTVSAGNGERRLDDSPGGATMPLWLEGCAANALLFGLEAIWTFHR